MFQVRVHGRGGQGVVTTADLLSFAAFAEGRHAQAFPSFGSERTGAPVAAFCRMDERAIRVREPVLAPDALIIQDATLLRQLDLFAGLEPDGYLLVNSTHGFAELGMAEFVAQFQPGRRLTVPATDLALTHLGRPMPGAALLGGFAAMTHQIGLSSVVEAIRGRFSGSVAEGNVAAAAAAYTLVNAEIEELTHAQAG